MGENFENVKKVKNVRKVKNVKKVQNVKKVKNVKKVQNVKKVKKLVLELEINFQPFSCPKIHFLGYFHAKFKHFLSPPPSST